MAEFVPVKLLNKSTFMKFSMIDTPYLVAGSIPFDAKDIHSLHQQGIRAIVSLTERSLVGLSHITQALFDELDINYLHAPIRDHYSPTLQQAQQILKFIEQMKVQKRMTFIHCHAGVGRTGTILHTYFLGQGLSLKEAQVKVKQQRIECILLSDRQKIFLKQFAETKSGESQ
jgi:atypical dual specificity phosphatase